MTSPPETRILHVFGCMNKGGAEIRTLEVMRATHADGFVQDFCALSGQRGSLEPEIAALGGRVHGVSIRRTGFSIRFLCLLRRGRYTVVHSHVLYASGLILALARLAGVKRRVAHFRSSGQLAQPSALRRCRYRILKRLIDCCATDIVAVSRSALSAVWNREWRSDARCRIIYNSLPTPPAERPAGTLESLGLPAGALPIVHVGRFDEPKNQARCVRIFERFLALAPAAWMVFIGRGGTPEEAAVRAYVAQQGLAERVVFLGEREDVSELLGQARALLFPSLWEGLPGAVLEALQVGLPVLASDIPVSMEISALVTGIRTLPLSVGDDEWARRLSELVTAYAAPGGRAAIRNSFSNSPFSAGASIDCFRRLWSGLPPGVRGR